jgi:hypothetical protein
MIPEGERNNFMRVWQAQSFPPIDERVGWAITIICLVLAVLLTGGFIRIQVGPMPGWVWIAIVCAQVVTAVLVAGATRISSRQRDGAEPSDAAADVPR